MIGDKFNKSNEETELLGDERKHNSKYRILVIAASIFCILYAASCYALFNIIFYVIEIESNSYCIDNTKITEYVHNNTYCDNEYRGHIVYNVIKKPCTTGCDYNLTCIDNTILNISNHAIVNFSKCYKDYELYFRKKCQCVKDTFFKIVMINFIVLIIICCFYSLLLCIFVK